MVFSEECIYRCIYDKHCHSAPWAGYVPLQPEYEMIHNIVFLIRFYLIFTVLMLSGSRVIFM